MALDDRTWMQLDPRAGRLTPAERRRVRVTVVVAVLLAVAAGVVWYTGVLVPRLRHVDGLATATDARSRTFRATFTVTNTSAVDIEVLAAGRSMPGLELVGTSGLPFPAQPGTGIEVELRYRVTDCAAVPTGAWPVPVRVEGPGGVRTVHLDLPGSDAVGFDGSSGLDPGPDQQPWFAGPVRAICDPATDS